MGARVPSGCRFTNFPTSVRPFLKMLIYLDYQQLKFIVMIHQ
jgi:hypothetical protein